ncbi:hypothetical protein [Arsenophonus endosymbiont of Bemisia tabaci]|uniref:hypothetical protein n=1 Tax=Arsenophonus endosymbiont of Bemisia tabaci TaxID=536059 RepID=UPI0015F3678B|nr:hypothetical protein [Arsenophonus endosymbiont of Bemisia tabaci]
MQKKSARMRHRYFVRTQYGVIKIKSLSYITNEHITRHQYNAHGLLIKSIDPRLYEQQKMTR